MLPAEVKGKKTTIKNFTEFEFEKRAPSRSELDKLGKFHRALLTSGVRKMDFLIVRFQSLNM